MLLYFLSDKYVNHPIKLKLYKAKVIIALAIFI